VNSSRQLITISIPLVALGFFACATGTTRPSGAGGGGGEGGDDWSGPAQQASSGTGSGGGGAGASSSAGAGGGSAGDHLPILVVRVGDGISALTNAAAPVALEWMLSDGSAAPGTPGITSLPTTASGSGVPFTLSGSATSEGALSLSEDGRYALLAGYDATVGTVSVSTQGYDVVPRVVGRVDGSGNVDTTTTLGSAFTGSSVRGAASTDGISIWVSGNSTSTGGVHFTTLGSTPTTQLINDPLNARCVHVAGGQLYATSGAGTYVNVFTVGNGLPTTSGVFATPLPGMPTASASPYSFVMLDRLPGVPGVDTLYVADDRSVASGGGIQKWTYDGSSWSLVATWSDGTTSVRHVAAAPAGSGVRVVATTTESSENRVLSLLDDGSPSPAIEVVAKAATNTVFRGVAIAPSP